MEMTLKKAAIGMMIFAIIMIILASISFADNQVKKQEIQRDQAFIARQMEIWETSGMMFRYGAARLRVKDLEKENKILDGVNKILVEDLIIAEWGKEYAYIEVRKMAFHIEFLQALLEINEIIYPVYVIESEE